MGGGWEERGGGRGEAPAGEDLGGEIGEFLGSGEADNARAPMTG